jgi:hypothetical protein
MTLPIVIRMLALLPFLDDEAVMDDRLIWIPDEMLDRGIYDGSVVEILLNERRFQLTHKM